MTLRWTNITALDIGIDRLKQSGGDLQKALQASHVRCEASLAWLYHQLAGNKKAADAIRRVAAEVDAAYLAEVEQSAVVDQYVVNLLARIGRRACGRS